MAKTHGFYHTKERAVWSSMIARCERKTCKEYKWYGERGIKVCDRWRKSFLNFIEDVGWRPPGKYSLDRIDNNKGYEPGNVRWATSKMQSRNKSQNVFIDTPWGRLTYIESSEKSGLNPRLIRMRHRKGESMERIFRPVDQKYNHGDKIKIALSKIDLKAKKLKNYTNTLTANEK